MIYLIALLFILAMVYLTKFRKVIFVAAGIAAAAVVIIAAMVEVHERQSDGVPPLPAGYTLDPQKRGDPWDMFPDANQSKPKNASLFDDLIPQKQSYERTSCCYRGYDLSKFGGAERRALEDAIDQASIDISKVPDAELKRLYQLTKG